MSIELDNQLADLIERCKQTDERIEQIRADTARQTVEVATVKVELSDEQMDVLLRDIGDLIGKVNVLEQRISDVNDAALYDRSQLEERIDALEQRVDGNAEQIRKDWNAEFKHYGYLEERLTEVEERIERMERKLNHKGGSE